MSREIVASSVLHSIGYNRTLQTLEIEFLNGSVHEYRGVPLPTYLALMEASSNSSYFQFFIEGKFRCRKVQ